VFVPRLLWAFFMPLMDRTVEERQETGGRERGNDMQQRPSGLVLKLGPTAVRTVASIHGVPAQPTAPLTTPHACFELEKHINIWQKTIK